MTTADLFVYQGDTPGWTVNVTDEGGTPVDISGYTAKAQIRRAAADADPEVAAEMSAVVQSPFVHLALTASQTAAMTGRYVWDLQLSGAGGEVITIMAGKVTVRAEVTREVA